MLPCGTPKYIGWNEDFLSSICTYCYLLIRLISIIFIELLLKFKFTNFFMSFSCWIMLKALVNEL